MDNFEEAALTLQSSLTCHFQPGHTAFRSVPNQDRDIKIGTNTPMSKFIFNNFFFLSFFFIIIISGVFHR